MRVSRNHFKYKQEDPPSSNSEMRNSSRDYFKNFDVEKFCTKNNASPQSSLGGETDDVEQHSSCPSSALWQAASLGRECYAFGSQPESNTFNGSGHQDAKSNVHFSKC